MDELFTVDVTISSQVENCEESLTNNAWELGVPQSKDKNREDFFIQSDEYNFIWSVVIPRICLVFVLKNPNVGRSSKHVKTVIFALIDDASDIAFLNALLLPVVPL